MGGRQLTVDRLHEFDEMEAGATDGATVGPFHPWRQTFIVKIMSAGSQMSDQLIRLVRVCWVVADVVVNDFGIGGLRDAANMDLTLRRPGRASGESRNFTITVAQVS